MHEAVQLNYIRNGLNCVIEQLSIYVFECCTQLIDLTFLYAC